MHETSVDIGKNHHAIHLPKDKGARTDAFAIDDTRPGTDEVDTPPKDPEHLG